MLVSTTCIVSEKKGNIIPDFAGVDIQRVSSDEENGGGIFTNQQVLNPSHGQPQINNHRGVALIPSLNIVENLNWFMHDPETKEMLADLIWLNAVIATELIQITENSSAILRKTAPPASCLTEHQALRETALSMAEKYRPGSMLPQHLGHHQ